MKSIIVLLKIAIIILFIITGCSDYEYEFYEIVRWTTLGLFTYFTWYSYRQNNIGVVIFFLLGIAMFNPIKHPKLDDETWKVVDHVFATGTAISLLFDSVPELIKRITDHRIKLPKRLIVIIVGFVVGIFFIYVISYMVNESNHAETASEAMPNNNQSAVEKYSTLREITDTELLNGEVIIEGDTIIQSSSNRK